MIKSVIWGTGAHWLITELPIRSAQFHSAIVENTGLVALGCWVLLHSGLLSIWLYDWNRIAPWPSHIHSALHHTTATGEPSALGPTVSVLLPSRWSCRVRICAVFSGGDCVFWARAGEYSGSMNIWWQCHLSSASQAPARWSPDLQTPRAGWIIKSRAVSHECRADSRWNREGGLSVITISLRCQSPDHHLLNGHFDRQGKEFLWAQHIYLCNESTI